MHRTVGQLRLALLERHERRVEATHCMDVRSRQARHTITCIEVIGAAEGPSCHCEKEMSDTGRAGSLPMWPVGPSHLIVQAGALHIIRSTRTLIELRLILGRKGLWKKG
jgi:hypothetical protein